jgi:hypothetical protein
MLQCADDGFEGLAFPAQLLRAFVVAPDVRVFYEPDDFAQALLLGIEVKDTSAAVQCVLRRPAGAWR